MQVGDFGKWAQGTGEGPLRRVKQGRKESWAKCVVLELANPVGNGSLVLVERPSELSIIDTEEKNNPTFTGYD